MTETEMLKHNARLEYVLTGDYRKINDLKKKHPDMAFSDLFVLSSELLNTRSTAIKNGGYRFSLSKGGRK